MGQREGESTNNGEQRQGPVRPGRAVDRLLLQGRDLTPAPTGHATLATRVFGHTSEGLMANAAPFAAAIMLFSSMFVGSMLAYEGRRRS